jgi:hypothetical protein
MNGAMQDRRPPPNMNSGTPMMKIHFAPVATPFSTSPALSASAGVMGRLGVLECRPST